MITNIDALHQHIAFQIEGIRNFNQEINNELDENINLLNIELVQLTDILILNGTLLIEGN